MMVGGVLVCLIGRMGTPPTPFFVVLFATQGLWGGCVATRGAGGCVRGLWGVVDVGDEFVLVLTITAAHVRFLCVAWTL